MGIENKFDKTSVDAISTAMDITKTTIKVAETVIKKVWSLLDAASQKQMPSEYLSPQAINAIQGNLPKI